MTTRLDLSGLEPVNARLLAWAYAALRSGSAMIQVPAEAHRQLLRCLHLSDDPATWPTDHGYWEIVVIAVGERAAE